MHIVFRYVGQFEIDHVRQLVDVQTARGNIGRDQHAQRVALEIGQRAGARVLALVAVDGGSGDALLVQLFGQPVGTVLGAGEYQHLGPFTLIDQVSQQVALLLLLHHVDLLRDALGRGVARRDLDLGRVVEQAVGQFADLRREGGRVQQGLAHLGQNGDHLADVADEAHIQHAVRFVQHENLDAGQIQRLFADVVEQTAGSGHQNVHALLERLQLRVHAHSAEHDHGTHLCVSAIGAHRLLDLGRQLAGRRQHEHARAPRRNAGRTVQQGVQDGQRKTGGLAGAGLRGGEQVAAGNHQRNGFLLDRRGMRVAFFGNGAQQGFCQAQPGEIDFSVQTVLQRRPVAQLSDTNTGRQGWIPEGRRVPPLVRQTRESAYWHGAHAV